MKFYLLILIIFTSLNYNNSLELTSYACDPLNYYETISNELDNIDTSKSRSYWTNLVHPLIVHDNIIPYTSTAPDVWDALGVLDRDPTDEGDQHRVMEIYTLRSVDWDTHGLSSGWNREHLWPKSWGVGWGGADFTDLHHLRPADWNVNAARNNLYFGTCDPETDTSCISPAHSEAADDTAKNSDLFLPPKSVRGNIARAMFYMAFRYDGNDSNTIDLQLGSCPCVEGGRLGNLTTLLEWHMNDPVDEAEIERNNKTCVYFQGNRNPFIDYPELVTEIWNSTDLIKDCTNVVCENVEDDYYDDDDTTTTTTTTTTTDDDTPIIYDDDDDISYSLQQNDLAIIGVNTNPDSFAILILKDLPKDSLFYITDNGWDGTSLYSNEGILKYKVKKNNGLKNGTVLIWNSDNSGDSNDFISVSGSLSLSTSGDQLLIFTNSIQEPYFIYGLNYDDNGWLTSGSISSTTSHLPSDLVNGKTAIALENHLSQVYKGSHIGTAKDLLEEISDSSLWLFEDSEEFDFEIEFNNFIIVEKIKLWPISYFSNSMKWEYNINLILFNITLLYILYYII